MTTSSFERERCTRISPSAVLDDRLDGKDLEWARDHLRRCETCRDRVEDFREMLLRVGRLPGATVSAAAMDQAFAMAIPERLRPQPGARSFAITPVDATAAIPPMPDLPMRPEITSVPDLLTELEREIFRDEPAQDHPTPLEPIPEPLYPTMAPEFAQDVEPARPVEVEPLASPEAEPVQELEAAEPMAPASPEVAAGPWREVPIESHRPAEPIDWYLEPEPLVAAPEPEPVAWQPEPEPAVEQAPVAFASNAVFDQEPALRFDGETAPPTPPRTGDNAMRIAVGLGAAACVLLAAVLYEGGWLTKSSHKVSSTAPSTRVSVHPSATTRLSASPSASPTAPPAPVLFTLGNGVSGNTVFRIRPGTAVAGFTRLVFDMHGSGLPTMIVTRPDDLHVAVTFKNTTVTGVPVYRINSYQVAGIEPAVQQGPDGTIAVDLARPVRVTAFTLAATGSYAWRLVLDLHTT